MVDIVVRIASMAEHHPAIVEMDCNRVMVMPRGVVVVDARVRVCARFLGSFQRVAIGPSATTATAEIGDDVGLLVVGGPTHAFGMSRPRTRSDATMAGGQGSGIRGHRDP